jgi:hypothetical protein
MTIPHLMNCSHSEDGWCLDCVAELHSQYEELSSELDEWKTAARIMASSLEWENSDFYEP